MKSSLTLDGVHVSGVFTGVFFKIYAVLVNLLETISSKS